MAIFMLVWRLVQKGEQFGGADAAFVVLFATAMAVFEFFRVGKTKA
ncbi:hypothetical protein ACFFF7_01240 [Novosphingobium aquiterrae]|uniref:Uncharacterized protein n=1 Tax=Novosphingobium aquiterrae TaxID=624388 RepID=A0ABV6PDY4_9SPHN